jgi:hypothetical protein
LAGIGVFAVSRFLSAQWAKRGPRAQIVFAAKARAAVSGHIEGNEEDLRHVGNLVCEDLFHAVESGRIFLIRIVNRFAQVTF